MMVPPTGWIPIKQQANPKGKITSLKKKIRNTRGAWPVTYEILDIHKNKYYLLFQWFYYLLYLYIYKQTHVIAV